MSGKKIADHVYANHHDPHSLDETSFKAHLEANAGTMLKIAGFSGATAAGATIGRNLANEAWAAFKEMISKIKL